MPFRIGRSDKLYRGLVSGAAGFFLALILWASDLIDTWEAKSWDWRVGLLAEPSEATDDIRLILLDQNSLDWGKEVNGLTWPWPREIYGAILNYCQRSGAKAVAFDVLFTDPSKYGVEDDASFARAVSDFGSATLATFLSDNSGIHSNWPLNIPPPIFKIIGLQNWRQSPAGHSGTYARSSMPIEELARNASVLSNVSLQPDADGIFRRVDLLNIFDSQILPSLGLGAYLAAHPELQLSIGPKILTVGTKKIPMDEDGRTILRFRGPSGTHKKYSAAAVLQSEIQILNGESPNIKDPNAFKDKYVLFGFSAPGLYDLRPSPLSGVMPGVEIYATFLDNFLSDDFMRQVPAWITVIILFILSMGCAITASYTTKALASSFIIAATIATPAVLSIGAYQQGFWLPFIVQEAAAIVTIGIVLVLNFTTEGRQKRFIKNAFRHFLSPEVIEQLIKHPEKLKLGGDRRVLSIFFSDLQGFTSISEKLDPEALVELLNDYLTAMTDIIHEEGGTIDKYEGDAIIAFWNAPLDTPDHAVKAVRAALRCQETLADMRSAFMTAVGVELHMRIGINTGPAVVGNLGSHKRFDYTIIGDAVNLAARLEGANKQFGIYTMISQDSKDQIGNQFATREIARLTVVGRKEPVTVYEPMTKEKFESKRDIFDKFRSGLVQFYEGHMVEGLDSFNKIKAYDAAAAAYAEKCRALMNTDLKGWQGVWRMTSK